MASDSIYTPDYTGDEFRHSITRDFYTISSCRHYEGGLESAVPIDETLSPSDSFDWKMIPRRRKEKMTLIMVCLLSVVICIYGFYDNETITYAKWDKKTKNETIILYKRYKNVTYPVFINLGFGLLGVTLGVFVERFCLVFEELHQLKTRYNRDLLELLKSCFSGISLKAVGVVIIIFTACAILGRKTPLSYVDTIFLILCGIGAGPLFAQFLNLKAESKIAVSRILETKMMYPGYTLAWSYYLNNLSKILRDFNELLKSFKHIKLSSKKIILLLLPGTDIGCIEDLAMHDEMIERLGTSSDENITIFKLTVSKHEHKYFAMACVREPLVALKKMKDTENVSFVDDTTYEDELNRFYKTLFEILEDAPDDECTKKGLLVPVTVNIGQYDKLKNGGLVRIIMEKVNDSHVLNTGSLTYQHRRRNNATSKNRNTKKKIPEKFKQDISEIEPLNHIPK